MRAARYSVQVLVGMALCWLALPSAAADQVTVSARVGGNAAAKAALLRLSRDASDPAKVVAELTVDGKKRAIQVVGSHGPLTWHDVAPLVEKGDAKIARTIGAGETLGALRLPDTNAFINGALLKRVTLVSSQSWREPGESYFIELEYGFFRRDLSGLATTYRTLSVDITNARPVFPPGRRQALVFGKDALPVVVVNKTRLEARGRNGNPTQEWWAQVVVKDSIERARVGRKPSSVAVYEVPMAALVTLDEEGYAQSLRRLMAGGAGRTGDEILGLETFHLTSVGLSAEEAAQPRKLAAKVRAAVKDKHLDMKEVRATLYAHSLLRSNPDRPGGEWAEEHPHSTALALLKDAEPDDASDPSASFSTDTSSDHFSGIDEVDEPFVLPEATGYADAADSDVPAADPVLLVRALLSESLSQHESAYNALSRNFPDSLEAQRMLVQMLLHVSSSRKTEIRAADKALKLLAQHKVRPETGMQLADALVNISAVHDGYFVESIRSIVADFPAMQILLSRRVAQETERRQFYIAMVLRMVHLPLNDQLVETWVTMMLNPASVEMAADLLKHFKPEAAHKRLVLMLRDVRDPMILAQIANVLKAMGDDPRKSLDDMCDGKGDNGNGKDEGDQGEED